MKNLELINSWVNLHRYMIELKASLAEVVKDLETFPKLKPLFSDCIELASILEITVDEKLCATPLENNEEICITDLNKFASKLNSICFCLKNAFKHYEKVMDFPLEIKVLKQLTDDSISIEVCEQCFESMNIVSLIE